MQLEKLRGLKKWSKRYFKNKDLSEQDKIAKWLIFDLKNPKWNKYSRDKSWRKVICIITWLREDIDGYRLVFKANSQEIEYVKSGVNSRLRKFLNKQNKR